MPLARESNRQAATEMHARADGTHLLQRPSRLRAQRPSHDERGAAPGIEIVGPFPTELQERFDDLCERIEASAPSIDEIATVRNGAELSIPVACVPNAIPAAERSGHFALAKQLFVQMAQARHALPDGYAFRFDASALEAIARFVENARKCCPFMTFELEVSPGTGPLSLRMTGPEGTRAVLDAELHDFAGAPGLGAHHA